jgi:Carboxypeptidase regulatory-like domain
MNSIHSRAQLCLLWAAAVLVAPGPAAGQTASATASPVNSAGWFRVAGTIVGKTDAHPLGRARVTLRDAKNPEQFESIITQEDGKFAFEHVPAGKYSLTGAKRGFITASFDQHDQFSTAIVTGAGIDTEALVLKIAPNAAIAGKVLDEAGEPVRHATVTLYYNNHQEGVDQIQARNVAQTDDLGAYDLPNLIPGTYFLSVRATPWYAVHPPEDSDGRKSEIAVDHSLDVAYPVMYYPDATDSDGATPIPLQGGEHLQVDMHLNPVPALHLLVHVPGDNRRGFMFPRLEQPAFDGSTFIQPNGGRMVSPGVFEVTGIPAGHYNLRIRGQGMDVQMNGVDLNRDGEQVDATAAEAMASLKLSVHTPEEPLPKGLTVALRSKARSFAGLHRLDEKGEGEINDIPAGNYEVVVFGSRKPYSIAHLLAEGAQVSGHRLTLAPGASASASLQLVAGSVEVAGVVTKAGTGFAGAMVVLVPKDPEGNRDLFRRDQSDLDGTFSLHNVVPGSYVLLAIENGWDLDWSEPGVIRVYAKHGRAMVVSDSERQLNLAEPVQVQSR